MPRSVDSGGVEWREPPGRPTRYDWRSIAAKVQKKPMAWYLVFTNDKVSLVNPIRDQRNKSLLWRNGFETTTSNNQVGPPRRCDLYVRYNPEHDERRNDATA